MILKWISKEIRPDQDEEYPTGYFDLFGSIDDESFELNKLTSRDGIKSELTSL